MELERRDATNAPNNTMSCAEPRRAAEQHIACEEGALSVLPCPAIYLFLVAGFLFLCVYQNFLRGEGGQSLVLSHLIQTKESKAEQNLFS